MDRERYGTLLVHFGIASVIYALHLRWGDPAMFLGIGAWLLATGIATQSKASEEDSTSDTNNDLESTLSDNKDT